MQESIGLKMTVKDFAKQVKRDVNEVLKILHSAGLKKTPEDDIATSEKKILLDHIFTA